MNNDRKDDIIKLFLTFCLIFPAYSLVEYFPKDLMRTLAVVYVASFGAGFSHGVYKGIKKAMNEN